MDLIKIFPPLVEFGVISLIGLKTINTKCFSPLDIDLSLGALIFSIIVEIYLIQRGRWIVIIIRLKRFKN